MAGEPDPLNISGDVEQHPPVDHPGRLKAEQNRAAHQTQGGPLSGLQQGIQAAGNAAGKAKGAVEGALGQHGGQKGQKDPAQGAEDLASRGAREGALVAQRAAGPVADFVLPPSVLQHLGRHPEYGDNPWLPLPQNWLDPQQAWYRTVHVGRAWRVLVNPDAVHSSVHNILNEHSTQGQLKRFILDADTPATAWIWQNVMPQLLVAAADGNPITGGLDLAGQAPDDLGKASVQAWKALPWSDYTQMADLLVHHPDQVGQQSPHLLASAFWKSITATLAIGGLLPDLRLLGEGRLALALPWRKYSEDAVSAVRRLPTDPDVPPPDRLAEVARNVQALVPTVVREAKQAGAAAGAAEQEILVDLSAHLNQIRDSLHGAGPSQDRAAELVHRLGLLNVRDPNLQKAYDAFSQLRKGDFTAYADFASARQQRWDDMLQALSKADASRVKMPSALNFLEAQDLDTLPTRTLRQLTRLAHEETAARAVRDHTLQQLDLYRRRATRSLFRGLFGRDTTKKLEAGGARLTEGLARSMVPHAIGDMTEGQQAFLRATWNKFMDYDLRRLHEEDQAPRPLHEYLDEVGQESRADAARFIGSVHGVLAFVQGGPHMLEDNAVESLTQSLLNRNRAHEGMLGEYLFPQIAALADRGGVDMEKAMDALRDDGAFQALSPQGRLIVDGWRHIQLLLRDRAAAVGHRSDFVGRFDPRVPVREAADEEAGLIPRLRSGQRVIGAVSKAHRVEAFVTDPHDPTRVALGEKYRTVRELNTAMQEARKGHVQSLVGQGVDQVEAEIRAHRRYPLYHQNLAYAMYEHLAPELRALNAHQAVQELLHAFTSEGARLAYQRTERAAPEAYRPLRTAGRAFQEVLFHPKFADAIDRANEHVSLGRFEAVQRVNNEAKQLIMTFPQIHAMNVAGRVLPMMLTHPWAALDELLGRDPDPALAALDPQTRRMYRVMQAMENGVVPHKAAREFFTNVMAELGNATGDSRMFEVPSGAQAEGASKFIRDKARQLPGLVGRITPSWLQGINDRFWRAVFSFQVLAYHVERRALAKRFPNLDPARTSMYAAFRANRWGGAIEPENWSQFGYHASRMLMFAPNWLRSYLELQMPVYLRGELAASNELRRYMWEQEIRSTVAFLAGQQITGNALNYLMSGHSIYENQPQNRSRVEIDPRWPAGRVAYETLHALDPAITQGIDVNAGVNPKTGAPLTWENPFSRQQTQLEQGLGLGDQDEPGAAETFAASHASPLVQALAMALNVDLYKTARNGAVTMEHEDPAGWNPALLLPALLQLTPVGYSFGAIATQAMHEGPSGTTQPGQPPPGGQATWQDQWKAWAHGLPLPTGLQDLVASAPDSALKTVISNAMGVQTPYERAETTKGTRLGDVQDAKLQKVLDAHHKVMASKSQDLMSGSLTPAQWLQWYQQYTPTYDGQLQAYFQGSPEYVNGQMGLYHDWQKLYADSELPDQSGIDWAKLEQKQADFRAHHTDAEMTAITAYQRQQEHAYPALQIYREVTDDHRTQQRTWARQLGLSDTQLLDMVKGFGLIYGDRHATGLYLAQHPQMAVYLRLNEEWEINSAYGRYYSLMYHTSAMRKWLAASGETEQQGARQLEQEWHA